MTRLAAVLLATLLAAVTAQGVRAENVIAVLSSKRVEIRSNFVGTQLVLFGTVERDARTVGRRSEGYNVAVVVEGPASNIVVRRKERIGGIWVNGAGIEFPGAPSYYAVLSNKPIADISSAAALKRQQIGLDNLKLTPSSEATPREIAEFREALVRRQQSHRLYFETPDAVQMLTPNMFMAQIRLPASIRTGGYRARIYVFSDGALVATERLGFWVVKTDFEAVIYDLAHRQPLYYGLGTVAMAFGVGWLGSILFRRN